MKTTIKNLFKKVDAYNEIAKEFNDYGVEVRVQFGKYGFGQTFNSMKEFNKHIKEDYYPEHIEVLKNLEVELDEATHYTVNYNDPRLGTYDEEITVYLVQKMWK